MDYKKSISGILVAGDWNPKSYYQLERIIEEMGSEKLMDLEHSYRSMIIAGYDDIIKNANHFEKDAIYYGNENKANIVLIHSGIDNLSELDFYNIRFSLYQFPELDKNHHPSNRYVSKI